MGKSFERAVAAVILAIPLLYFLTDRTRDPWIWRYGKRDLLAIAVLGAVYLAFLFSYRRELPKWIAGLRKVVVILAASTVFALVAVELGLRATDSAPYSSADNSGRHAPDPDVGHVYYPNFSQIVQAREFRTEWRSNAEGLRADRDYGAKPAGVYRIVIVGDSFTVGDQVAVEATYPSVLQSRLDQELGPGRVEVLNAGYPGFNTVNEAVWIRKFGPALDADLFLIGMTPNDLLENRVPLQYVARDGAMVSSTSTDADEAVWAARKHWTSLPGYVNRSQLMRRFRTSPLYRRLRGGSPFTHHLAYSAELDDRATQLYDLAREHLLLARDHAVAQGARFGLFVIPFREQLGDLQPGLDPLAFGERMLAFAEEHGFPAWNLLPAFREHTSPADLYWREDSHCTAVGYRVIGEGVFEFVTSNAAFFGVGMGD